MFSEGGVITLRLHSNPHPDRTDSVRQEPDDDRLRVLRGDTGLGQVEPDLAPGINTAFGPLFSSGLIDWSALQKNSVAVREWAEIFRLHH